VAHGERWGQAKGDGEGRGDEERRGHGYVNVRCGW
jgi:hypothetical protein